MVEWVSKFSNITIRLGILTQFYLSRYSWLANIFRRRNKEPKRDFVANTIKHCLERQSAETVEQLRYFILFPEDVNIPYRSLEVVLGKSKYEVEEIVGNLCNKALVRAAYNHELQCYVCGIHTMLQGYLLDELDKKTQRDMHRQLVQRYELTADGNYAALPNDNYIYTYIGYHLRKAELPEEFPRLYFNLHFLAAKARAAGVADLLLDLSRYKKDITQFRSELVHRLEACENFVHNFGQQLCDRQSLDVIQLALVSPDAEIRRLGESAASAAPHRLYLRARIAGEVGAVCDETPHTPALELGENVRAACFAHHAHLVLVGGTDGRVRMWNHGYRSAELEYHGHINAPVLWLEVAPNQTRFLSLGGDGLVKVWPLDERSHSNCHENGTSSDEYVPSPRVRQPNWLDVFEQPGSRPSDVSRHFRMDKKIVSAAFSRFGDSLLVTGSEDGHVIVWDVDSETRVFENHDKAKPVCACALADNDHSVIFAVDHFVYIYDLGSGEYLAHLNDEPDIRQMLVVDEVSEDARLVVRSRRAFNIWRWGVIHAEGGQVRLNVQPHTHLAQLKDPNEEYTCAAVTWDGLYLIAGTSSGTLLMWGLNGGGERELVPSGSASALCLDTFLDEESNSNVVYLLLSGGGDGRVRRWHVTPGIAEQESNVSVLRGDEIRLTGTFAAHWMEGKPLIAAATENYNVRVYVGCTLVAETPRALESPRCLSVSPDGQHVAVGHTGGLVYVFDYRRNTQQCVMHLTSNVAYLEYVVDSSGSSVLVAATDDGCIMSAIDGKSLLLQKGGGKSVMGLILSVWVGSSLLTVSRDGCVKSWRQGGLSDVLKAANERGAVTAASVTIRRDRLCMVRADGHACLYTLDGTCKFQKDKLLGDSPLTVCSWSSDARHLAVGDESGRVFLLHVSSGGDITELARLIEHRASVRSLSWSPPPGGGAPLVLASAGDRLVAWWDAGRLAEQAVGTGVTARRRSAARRSRPEALDLTSLGPALPQVMSDPAWCGKRGQPDKQELLGAFPLAGDVVHQLCPSPDFTRFVTVDAAGVLHVLSVLRAGDAAPSSPEPVNSPT